MKAWKAIIPIGLVGAVVAAYFWTKPGPEVKAKVTGIEVKE